MVPSTLDAAARILFFLPEVQRGWHIISCHKTVGIAAVLIPKLHGRRADQQRAAFGGGLACLGRRL